MIIDALNEEHWMRYRVHDEDGNEIPHVVRADDIKGVYWQLEMDGKGELVWAHDQSHPNRVRRYGRITIVDLWEDQ